MKLRLDPLSPTGLSQVSDVTLVAEGGSSSGGGAVSSVNGQTGAVVLTADDVLPSQTGNNGKFLSTDGTNSSWTALAGGGDMLAATYDPQAIADDAFARANHTGTQLLATISDVTASAAELNLLDGVTSTTTELNYTDGVTSPIQTQINTKAPTASPTFTGTVSGVTAAMVGLGNVDNTSNATERAATATLTNKRITLRASTEASSATPTINTDNVNFHSITALTTAITSMTTNLSGTPTEAQKLHIAITGTAARAITWGASFEASTIALPTTTVSTDRLDVGFVWNTVTSKWRIVATC